MFYGLDERHDLELMNTLNTMADAADEIEVKLVASETGWLLGST